MKTTGFFLSLRDLSAKIVGDRKSGMPVTVWLEQGSFGEENRDFHRLGTGKGLQNLLPFLNYIFL